MTALNDLRIVYDTCARRVPCPLGASKMSPCQASLKPTISMRPSSTYGGVKSLCEAHIIWNYKELARYISVFLTGT